MIAIAAIHKRGKCGVASYAETHSPPPTLWKHRELPDNGDRFLRLNDKTSATTNGTIDLFGWWEAGSNGTARQLPAKGKRTNN